MTDMIVLGEDLGMGANKLYGLRGGSQMLSQVASNGASHLSEGVAGLRSRQRPLEVTTEAGTFYVGEGAHDFGRPVENLAFDRLTGAPEMRALLYASLAQYQVEHGAFEAPLDLMVGLPLQMVSGEEAKETSENVKKWMRGLHRWVMGGLEYQAEITRVRVTAQPVGALFDYILDERGQTIGDRRILLSQEVGVISVGFNTLELLTLRDLSAVERFTGGDTVGVRRLLELVNRGGMYSLGELDSMLRAGRLDVSQAMPVWARELNGVIEKRWGGSHRRFAKILVVGGGAVLLKEQLLAQFRGRAVVLDEPVLAIARGLWKMGLRK